MVFCSSIYYVHVYTLYRFHKNIYKTLRYLPNTKIYRKKSTIGTFTSEKRSSVLRCEFLLQVSFSKILLRVYNSVLNSFNKIIFITFAVAVISLSDYICISETFFFRFTAIPHFSRKFDFHHRFSKGEMFKSLKELRKDLLQNRNFNSIN